MLVARLRRRPGIVSRDKVREALCPHWTCDPVAAPPPNSASPPLTSHRDGPRSYTRLVQGGRLVELLSPMPPDPLLGRRQGDPGLPASSSVVLIAGWWSHLPTARPPARRPPRRHRPDAVRDQAPQPHHLDFPELVSAALRSLLLQGNGVLIPAIRHRMRRPAGWPISTSASGAPTPPCGWSVSQYPALTEFLQIVYTLFVPAVCCVAFLLWRRGDLPRVPILWPF